MNQKMNMVELIKSFKSSADNYRGHNLAVLDVIQQIIDEVTPTLHISQKLHIRRTAYLITPKSVVGRAGPFKNRRVCARPGKLAWRTMVPAS